MERDVAAAVAALAGVVAVAAVVVAAAAARQVATSCVAKTVEAFGPLAR